MERGYCISLVIKASCGRDRSIDRRRIDTDSELRPVFGTRAHSGERLGIYPSDYEQESD